MAKLKKIQASTLVETIVAMVIITVIFSIALLIIANIAGRKNPQLRFKAYSEAQNTINNSLSTADFEDEEWQEDGLFIEKRILRYKEYNDLRILDVSIYDNKNRLLVEKKELIKIANETH